MSAPPLASGSLRARAFPPNWPLRIGAALFLVYVAYAAQILDIRWERFVLGLDNGARFIGRMFPPNTAADKMQLLWSGMLESLQIAIIATAAGVLLALPLGLFAARNLMPLPVTVAARGVIALCRTFHPVIVAILFVKAVGFGALAGVKVSPAGEVVSEAEWAAKVDSWLPSATDRAFVASLMGRVVEPGKFANWIAPPVMGINRQPVDFEYVRFA